jgi:hypothetical protein
VDVSTLADATASLVVLEIGRASARTRALDTRAKPTRTND